MSVLVSSLANHHHYFSNNSTRRMNGNLSPIKSNRLPTAMKPIDHEQNNDQVPYGVVNSMKQRFLNKVNESYLINHNSTLVRQSLTKPASSSSNENLLQTKSLSPLKQLTRLSRSQDNLTNHSILPEQITSYIQPKQDVIIVEITEDDCQGKLHPSQKTSGHRQSYTELHVDEAPKPGTVTTVKNMFERQIRLSRFDADKLITSSTPGSSRMSSQHREISSPIRSRSTSPHDLLLRQKRPMISSSTLPLPSTTLSLPVPTSYPDVVISHTPPTETNKNLNEQITNENLLINNQGITKEKKILLPIRQTLTHEHIPLSVIVDESTVSTIHHSRPNLLLPSTTITTSETIDSQPLDFKSRLALFNRTNIPPINENSINTKKSFNQTNSLPIKSVHVIPEEKKDFQPEILHNQFSRSVVNTAKAVTFFGGNKLNGDTNSSLPSSISPPVFSQKTDQPSSIDVLRAPDIIGGNVKLNKSSIFSGTRKDVRVQFIDNVHTFEYPSFEVAMAELGSTGSDNDDEEDNNPSSTDSNEDNNPNYVNIKIHHDQEDIKRTDDVDDDELERLARFNAEFNTNNLSEKSLKPKGTLHTFRPTHLDQYELGSLPLSNSSDISTGTNSYTILARQKLQINSDTATKTSMFKQSKPTYDLSNNIQWSSMSTTTDLLF